MSSVDDRKSIEELENSSWGAPKFDSSVMRRAYAMRQKPLSNLSPAEIYTGLLQQVGVVYIIPLALELVRRDPWLQSRYYPGDLLCALLEIPPDFWTANSILKKQLEDIYDHARAMPNEEDEETIAWLEEAHARFRGDLPSRGWHRSGTYGSDCPT